MPTGVFGSMRLLLPAALAVLAFACSSQLPEKGASQSADLHFTRRVHKMPRRASNPTPGASGANLQYYGGHVIPNVKVYEVLFGGGTYAPEVSGPQMGNFYAAMTNSAFMDWLSEYNTNISAVGGQAGTNQIIGRGSFGGQISITPGSSGTSIDDSAIQTELAAQIASGALPAPDENTLYMLHFPQGLTVTQGGSGSCVSGGFCAYHGTFTRNGASVYYGVLPDMSAGSGCDTGCGSDPAPFNNQTSVASHEFTEAITDAEVGLATANAPPLAWYDQTNGEIGDICNAQQGNFVGDDGVTYTVQQEWSNLQQACVDHGAGSTTTPPPPPPANTCTVDTDCASGQVCVNGTCQDSTPPPPKGGALGNGDFETGDLGGWTVSGSASVTSAAHGGSYAAQVGSVNPSADSSIGQTLTLPAGTPQLSFWFQVNCPDTITYDWASAALYDTSGNVLTQLLPDTCRNDGTWQKATADLTAFAGQTVVLTFSSHDDGYAGDPTYTLYDDVTIQ